MREWRYIATHSQSWNLIECSGRFHTATVRAWEEAWNSQHRGLGGLRIWSRRLCRKDKFLAPSRNWTPNIITVFWNVMLIILVAVLTPYSGYRNLRKEQADNCESSLISYQAARCHIPKANNPHHLVSGFQVKFDHLVVKGKFNTTRGVHVLRSPNLLFI